MYKSLYLITVLTVWVLTGCSSYNLYSDQAEYYENINEKVEGKEVKVTYVNGESLKVKDFLLTNDSASWIDMNKNSFKMPADEIKRIGIKNRFYGGLTGFAIGSVAGGSVGLLIKVDGKNASMNQALNMIAGMLVGGVAGLITGAITGVWDNYYLR